MPKIIISVFLFLVIVLIIKFITPLPLWMISVFMLLVFLVIILITKFITPRPLWVNILTGVLLTLVIFAIFFLSLNWFTNHGSSITVPSVTGKKIDEARKQLSKSGFDIEIQDSIYVDSLAPMVVIKQIPDADEMVKSNRTVYLIINRSVPPIVEMPNLTGYSYRNAEMVLKNMDLRIGDTIYKPDFAKNAVLEQLYKGSIIAPGSKIRKGSVISLVLGDGVGKKEFAVPVITRMQFCEARDILEEYGIVIGVIIMDADVSDTCSSWIFKQNPVRFDDEKRIQHIRSGQTMDVWLQRDKPAKDTSSANTDNDNQPDRKVVPKPTKPENDKSNN